MNPAWIAAIAAMAGVIGGVLIWVFRRIWSSFQLIYSFLQDWNGHPGDAGHEARPGVMARMAKMEHGLTDVQAQVHLNSGSSLKDAVTRTEQNVTALTSRVTDVQVQVGVVQATVDELKAR